MLPVANSIDCSNSDRETVERRKASTLYPTLGRLFAARVSAATASDPMRSVGRYLSVCVIKCGSRDVIALVRERG